MEVTDPPLNAQVLEHTTGLPDISVCARVDEIEVNGNGPRVAVEGYALAEGRSPKGPEGRGGSCHIEPIAAYEKEVECIPRNSAAGAHARGNTPPKNVTEDFRGHAHGKVEGVPEAFEPVCFLYIVLGLCLEILDGVGVNCP